MSYQKRSLLETPKHNFLETTYDGYDVRLKVLPGPNQEFEVLILRLSLDPDEELLRAQGPGFYTKQEDRKFRNLDLLPLLNEVLEFTKSCGHHNAYAEFRKTLKELTRTKEESSNVEESTGLGFTKEAF